MLDGRHGILLGSAFSLVLAACGGTGDVGAVAAEVTPGPVTTTTTVDDTPVETNDAPTTDTEVPPSLGSCGGANPPARCSADPQTFDGYGLAALITQLELLPDETCCSDFDDDGDADNALGQGMSDIGKLAQLNAELATSLVTGTQTILLELEGLDNPANDTDVALHVYSGQRVDSSPTSGPEVALDPTSFAQGVMPLFTFENTEVRDGQLIASQGELELEASFNGVLLKPVVHEVRISAQIESFDGGLTLRDGVVGGRLELSELDAQINAVASGCDCLGLDTGLITNGTCSTPDVSACEQEGRETCAAIVEVCPVLELIASNLADIDSDGDGVRESISLGALFEADSARITGVMR